MAIAKVFISYRRIPSAMLATLLNEKLKAQGIDAYVDTRRTDGGGPFPNRLLRAIEDSDVFVCLLADTTLDSDWVRREIEHAYSQAKPMIPVFQESYSPLATPSASSINALLQSDGIHVLDEKNLYVDQAVADLARMIKLTLGIEVSHAGDTTEIGERTYNLRPMQPASRRWPWMITAMLIVVLGILLFVSVNRDIINAAVAATQTAIALAGEVTETPTLTDAPPTSTLTATYTVTPSPTLTNVPVDAAFLVIGERNVPIRSIPAPTGEIIATISNQRLLITGISVDRLYYRIECCGTEAWVGISYGRVEGDLSSVPTIGARLIIGSLNVPIRSLPAPTGEIIATISNQRLTITGISSDRSYYRIAYNGLEAWVAISYGRVEGNLSNMPIIDSRN